MPDDLDYQWLARTLATPERWTEKELGRVTFLLRQARESLAETPDNHFQARRSFERSIADYEAALGRYESSRP
jgi:hypothetical protein